MKRYLGIELGSTRIKALIIDEAGATLASGSCVWENKPLPNNVWTYDLAEARKGLSAAYVACADDYATKYGECLARFDALGISAMMHGYLVFDRAMKQLSPFRTWRSTNASKAATDLSSAFDFNVPIRWSIAQLYQSVLDGEAHVKDIVFQTTLAGYIHFILTGKRVLGLDDASGMFPVDPATKAYDTRMVSIFKEKTGIDVTAIFPEPLPAGADAGVLTAEGAKLLDPSGTLEAGIPLCPPEGDGGTGMVATNAVRPGTGNVSVGTSVFAMTVLERPLTKAYPEIDVVATPAGDPVAMVHCNNGCGELDKWIELFGGNYAALLTEAVNAGDADCGGITATNWIAAEPLAGVENPFPYLTHTAEAHLTRANIIRAELKAVFATLAMGMELLRAEGVYPKSLIGHGGLFKTKGVAESVLSGMLGIPVATRETAGEGGAWGIAMLAAYRDWSKGRGGHLAEFLDVKI